MKPITASIIFIVLTACVSKKADTKIESEHLMEISREWSRSAATDSM